jgi:UDP-N-acetylmuramoyl-tripeptide--D-alanyl-D-alanine ligase
VIALRLAELAEALGSAVASGYRVAALLDARDEAEIARLTVLAQQLGAHDVLVISHDAPANADATADALKAVAQIVGPGQRSVAILGELPGDGDETRDDHDHLGLLAVRLNIGKLVVVGEGARHIHLAAGLQGSWDGESVLVADVDAAYDLLREQLRAGDVVLVKSSKSAGGGSE